MNLLRKLISWARGLFGEKPRGVQFFEGDELPAEFATRNIYVAREDGDFWSAGLTCPCGCGRRLEVMLLKGVKPRWDLSIDAKGLPSLHPSVWVADGCRSHFWLRHGKIDWC
ncbi:hypothetical protein LAV84_23585 [Rhizobium sp. VS19-DR104.2]|uniref:DUF6527 family protein n=1 Tax=unclassified Rhizobium TaxID=2613769 RepID=UPI001CC49E6E|nr:hypothetical protein [Rhizobium sp. VS19-DR96]MBZ5768259.1 hypothetical protein [Rhizobium sp. VS19-DR129.2]MBZ5775869.1 hypothetical protein [Rhizobium sp. VS19-DRK62.2]MBZ5787110.1 hypothetical protein [Rhizobium sp. VS19-DR121]MBZ5804184.1 hypothetical protein [Rhizobium sp. VS19-DR181]MBZ5820120.1 hypothetical protein [Rhizobium sp. VS19-DR183]MBZ5832676.1 hypothetical protein [Rhizobium sp. VS19-DR104.2]MBZ5843810.1 hypothetical protein [Rhizobium sp. VS19-DR104.1]